MADPISVQIHIDVDDTEFELTAAADLLSDADVSTRATRPYELPDDAELFGDLVRTSAQHTVPLSMDELPDDAFPTEIYFVGIGSDT